MTARIGVGITGMLERLRQVGVDNLERALVSDVSTSPERLRQGVQMTLQRLTQLLRRHGIEPEESLGWPFDPALSRSRQRAPRPISSRSFHT